MQSEIKFRGKRVDTGEWVYGNLLKLESGFFTDNNDKAYEWYIIPTITNGCWSKNNLMLKFISPCFEVIPETVGKYTGLKDKNGKEIYEGDIFKWEDSAFGYIKYKDGSFYLKIAEIYSPWLRVIKHKLENELEVIGNVYNNPELLQEVE
ncbi:MAG: YopX family protein [Anaerocolumna aminovalerica]|uniref:YopX family protein n=1 Tax=Anaerocolumna aminovalerica TaxID=1527 RepID=UPI00290CB268|nr:YopX family protein [Anaerocolumna aminovalerica]MDU6263755.1 YopX family protein [Anaerocolumna aminovalerica]